MQDTHRAELPFLEEPFSIPTGRLGLHRGCTVLTGTLLPTRVDHHQEEEARHLGPVALPGEEPGHTDNRLVEAEAEHRHPEGHPIGHRLEAEEEVRREEEDFRRREDHRREEEGEDFHPPGLHREEEVHHQEEVHHPGHPAEEEEVHLLGQRGKAEGLAEEGVPRHHHHHHREEEEDRLWACLLHRRARPRVREGWRG